MSSSFSKHLGPRFMGAGLRLQFHYMGDPGIHFKTNVSAEYREAILRGISDAMKERFPRFAPTGSLWITEVMEHPIDSSQAAFYLAARSVIEQAYVLTRLSNKVVEILKSPT